MAHAEMTTTDQNKSNIIRKKSSFLRDGSYRIFHITKESKEDNDDDNNNNIDHINDKKTNKFQKKSLKITNENRLKKFLFFHQTSDESSSIESKIPSPLHDLTNELSQPVICHDKTLVKLSKKNKRQSMVDWSKTDDINEIIADNNLLVRANKSEQTSRKQIFINIHPEIHRRRKRFIVACSTVLIALSIIITIIVYVIIMTVKHKTQMNQLSFNKHPR